MKIFPIASNKSNAAKKHLEFLNQQCNALMQFKHQFQPGFKVFNESPILYTYEELLERGVLRLAKLPNTDSSVNSLIVVASKLSYGEGVINTFPYTNVYVFYGDSQNLYKPPYGVVDGIIQIPPAALPGEDVAFIKSKLYFNNRLILTYDSDTPEGTLILSHGEDSVPLTNENTFLKKYFPNYQICGFVDSIEQNTPEDGVLEELESSGYIISVYSNEKGYSAAETLDRTNMIDKRNYLIARLARGGGYYRFAYSIFNKNGEDVLGAMFSYEPEATDSMGLKYVIDGDPRQKRFFSTIYYDLFEPKVSSATALSFITSDNETISQIKTTHGGIWSGNNLINHEFHFKDEQSNVESFIADDTRLKTTTKLNKTATPSYKVNFNNQYGFTPLFILW